MSILEQMSHDLLIPETYLKAAVDNREAHYRKVVLSSGRIVWQPSQRLSLMQYWIVDYFGCHDKRRLPFAYAYEQGSSVVENAKRHIDARHILAMDIKSFFPSITEKMVRRYFGSVSVASENLTSEDLDFLVAAVCFRGGLVMGAPSSPFLSNRVMIPVDEAIHERIAVPHDLTYTRYSDDLFLSSVGRIDCEVADDVRVLLREFGFWANDDKTRFLGPGSSRMVAGVCVNQENRLSLGQKRKQELRKLLYHFAKAENATKEDAQRVLGYLNFCRSVEPAYVGRMLIKYSKYDGDVVLKAKKLVRGSV